MKTDWNEPSRAMRHRSRTIFCGSLLTIVSALAGCSSIKPGNVHAVKPVSAPVNPRVGNAYLLRGFIGVFSTGIDSLGEQLNQSGVQAAVFQDDQWAELAANIRKKYRAAPQREPIVLIGHSYGADDVIR